MPRVELVVSEDDLIVDCSGPDSLDVVGPGESEDVEVVVGVVVGVVVEVVVGFVDWTVGLTVDAAVASPAIAPQGELGRSKK